MTYIVCHSNKRHIYSSKVVAFNNKLAYIKSIYYNVNHVQAFFLG